MKPSLLLRQHHVTDIKVFGSAMHENDQEGSELDSLVEPTADTTLFDIGAFSLRCCSY